jgi:DNA-binding GntR family transcriptional regulator
MITTELTLPDGGGEETREHGTNVQYALREIKRKIIGGDLDPGKVVLEEELADGLGMSRTPVRVALAILEEEGLIERVSRSTTRVRETKAEEIKEILALRYVIESLVGCELARKDDEDRERMLGELLGLLGDAAKCKEIAKVAATNREPEKEKEAILKFVSLDTEFHCRMAELVGFSQAANFLRSVRHKVLVYLKRSIPNVGKMESILTEHERIVEAIRSKKPGDVKKKIHNHLVHITHRWFPDYRKYLIDLGRLM